MPKGKTRSAEFTAKAVLQDTSAIFGLRSSEAFRVAKSVL